MKKIILSVTLLCIVCLLFGSCTTGNSTTSQADSGDPVSDVISNKDLSIGTESTEPLDVPTVVTRSHMVEKVGEDADLVQEALKLYAGQDTKYCIVVTAEEKAEFESFMEFAAELYRAQYHCEVWPGCSDGSIMGGYGDYLEEYQNGLYGTFYIDKDMRDRYWQHKDDAYWLSPLYAELPEAALRAVLECGGVSVQLFDAFPENVAEIGASVAA